MQMRLAYNKFVWKNLVILFEVDVVFAYTQNVNPVGTRD